MTPQRRARACVIATLRVGIALAWVCLLQGRALATEFIFPDLKQDGSAALLLLDGPDGSTLRVLVDAGRPSLKSGRGAALLRELLNRRGITQIDLAIITHLDEDHAGLGTLVGADDAQAVASDENAIAIRGPPITIRQVIAPTMSIPAAKAFWLAFRTSPQAQAIQFLDPAAGDPSALYTNFGLRIVTPPATFTPKTSNETSLIVTVRDPRTSRDLLLTGDLTARTERLLRAQLPEHVAVLHAPHHGADRVVQDLAARLSPTFIVISANIDNRYGHPSPTVLRSLARIGHVPVDDDLAARVLSQEDAIVANVDASMATLEPAAWSQRYESRIGSRGFAWLTGALGRPAPLPPLSGTGLYSDQILITGEHGDIRLDANDLSVSTRRDYAVERELVWNELRYVPESALSGFTGWRDLQAYLALRVAERYRHGFIPDPSPLHSRTRAEAIRSMQDADLVRIMHHVDPKSTFPFLSFAVDESTVTPPSLDSIRAFGQQLVPQRRWAALMARRQEEHRLLWSQVIEGAMARLVGPYSPRGSNPIDLVMAAVQDVLERTADPNARPSHLKDLTKSIKDEDAARRTAASRASYEAMRKKLYPDTTEPPGVVESALGSMKLAEYGWARVAIAAARALPRARLMIP